MHRLVGAGLVVGMAGSLAVGGLVSSMACGIGRFDAPTLAIVATLLAPVTLRAACLPARRAAHINPLTAMPRSRAPADRAAPETMERLDVTAIARTVAHRPWPLPARPWIMVQSWRNQLFAHWRITPDVMRAHVPAPLELDLFDRSAWLGLTPFLLTGLHLRGLPAIPTTAEFPELNLRTYVIDDGRPGVFFFSLDAASLLAVLGARATFRLPYHHAHMRIAHHDGWTHYASRRRRADAELQVRYRATSPSAYHAATGTLDYFIVERYALYVMRGVQIMRGDIHHLPWALHPAEALFQRNTVPAAAGLSLPEDPPLLHYSTRQDALIWPPVRAH